MKIFFCCDLNCDLKISDILHSLESLVQLKKFCINNDYSQVNLAFKIMAVIIIAAFSGFMKASS